MYSMHFKWPFVLTQALLPLIADKGRILNIFSDLACFSLPSLSAYGSMKAALETPTRRHAQERGPRGISEHALAPSGAIETDLGGGAVRREPFQIINSRTLVPCTDFQSLRGS
jgi:NAD(P)-dependent dehydrogenase (short-subunit alcohol dehydrogenase family)